MAKPVMVIVAGGSGHMAAGLLSVLIAQGHSGVNVDPGHVRVAGRGLPGDPPDVLDLPHSVVGQRLIGAGQARRRPVAPYQPLGSKRRHRRNQGKMDHWREHARSGKLGPEAQSCVDRFENGKGW